MRYAQTVLALAAACALNIAAPRGEAATAPGFTLLYTADERGEITPCG